VEEVRGGAVERDGGPRREAREERPAKRGREAHEER